ncbi:hypothetical protein PINS_up010317 [Pythium insidiosum]|nr:hypothetical protein PINS_up010317 [Pythium insidiosum]
MEQDEFAAWYHENERRARAVDMLEKLQLLIADAAALYHAADARLQAHLARVEQEQQRTRAPQLETLVLEVDGARAVLVRAFQLRRVLQQQVRHLLTTRDDHEEERYLDGKKADCCFVYLSLALVGVVECDYAIEASDEQAQTMEDDVNEALASFNWEAPSPQDEERSIGRREEDAVAVDGVPSIRPQRRTVSRMLVVLLPLTLLVAIAGVVLKGVWTS